MLLRKRLQTNMAAMNPAIIGIVNYRRHPRGPNIARAACQERRKLWKIHETRTTGDSRVDSDQTFGQCLRLNFCFALLCLLCFGLRLKSQTKCLIWDFSLRPNLNLNSVWNHFFSRSDLRLVSDQGLKLWFQQKIKWPNIWNRNTDYWKRKLRSTTPIHK